MNSPNSQVILKYHQVYLNSQPSTVTTNLEGSRPLVSVSMAVVSVSTTAITSQIFLQKLYIFTHRAVIPNVGVCKAHYTST